MKGTDKPQLQNMLVQLNQLRVKTQTIISGLKSPCKYPIIFPGALIFAQNSHQCLTHPVRPPKMSEQWQTGRVQVVKGLCRCKI